MKEKSIELLNKAIADELSAVHQYMYFHFHCDDQGYDLLANLFKRTAIEEMLTLAAEMETSSARDYNNWANECSQNADSVSKTLFESLVQDEERHFDQYDVEMDNLNRFGDNYLALQSIERSKNLAAGNTTE